MASSIEALSEPREARCAICGYAWDAYITVKTFGPAPDYPMIRTDRVDPGPRRILRHFKTDLTQEDHSVHRLCLLALQNECAKNDWPRMCPACSKIFIPIAADEEVPDGVHDLIKPALESIFLRLVMRPGWGDEECKAAHPTREKASSF
jgi:hypothetical protein